MVINRHSQHGTLETPFLDNLDAEALRASSVHLRYEMDEQRIARRCYRARCIRLFRPQWFSRPRATGQPGGSLHGAGAHRLPLRALHALVCAHTPTRRRRPTRSRAAGATHANMGGVRIAHYHDRIPNSQRLEGRDEMSRVARRTRAKISGGDVQYVANIKRTSPARGTAVMLVS